MAGVAITIDSKEIDALNDRIAALANMKISKLLDGIGQEVENQTRNRLSQEKAEPDGTSWAPWSEDYKATRHSGHSLLEDEGGLIDSIAYQVVGDEVEVGSNLIYAAIHQLGGADIDLPQHKARPYLGISDNNAREIQGIIDDFIKGQLKNVN